MTTNPVHGALFGVAIGDALGVPAEFKDRSVLRQDPVTDFIGYKSHNQPPGAFSDDSSLTFCLAESLCLGYDLNDVGKRFVMWIDDAYWTAGGVVFDVGNTTYQALRLLQVGVKPELSGCFEEGCNGNGSLMRILPLLFYIREFDVEKRYKIVYEVSSVTHGHEYSVISCFYYLEFALEILKGKDKHTAYANTATTVYRFLINKGFNDAELNIFTPLLKEDIIKQDIDTLPSSGYVVSTLKASMYCFLTTTSFQEATLMAVNLGDDADTTAAVTGGLAGLYYGFDSIPEKWRHEVKRSNDIKNLCDRLAKATGL
jgi:ADP-ribosylglycohydrolase